MRRKEKEKNGELWTAGQMEGLVKREALVKGLLRLLPVQERDSPHPQQQQAFSFSLTMSSGMDDALQVMRRLDRLIIGYTVGSLLETDPPSSHPPPVAAAEDGKGPAALDVRAQWTGHVLQFEMEPPSSFSC
ncbi:hypothetical protein OPV22_003954 [Ensete ventricosum]|uniref:Uncharacterized protein n=1 Tax=Ensete ventricosum TaxID=4639 RepID=A0AAV8S2E1_ENSVE|nr:hypothetical protein OPV22_003954 [Ensete ventricosum]